jgi:hypothetical protein
MLRLQVKASLDIAVTLKTELVLVVNQKPRVVVVNAVAVGTV